MAALDLYAICNAMATALAAVTPPSGDAMRKAYGQAPNNIPSLPCAIVEPQNGSLVLSPGAYNGSHTIDVILLIETASGDYPRIETRRQKWLPVILHAFDSAMALGLAPVVKKVYPTTWDFVDYEYGKQTYQAIRVVFTVDSFETVTLAA